MHLTPERLGKERQLLIDTPTYRETKRSSATVNRYIASLSLSLTYACRQLRWINENPCFNLIKLKEAPGRDRVLSDEETQRLLAACRESRCAPLHCIVLMAFTTGMRQGEILGLTWNQIDFENQIAHLKEREKRKAKEREWKTKKREGCVGVPSKVSFSIFVKCLKNKLLSLNKFFPKKMNRLTS